MNPAATKTSAFIPDPQRADQIDRQVREGLAASLNLVFNQIAAPLGFGPERATVVLNRIRTQAIAPRVMAAYADLVEAIYADDEPGALSLLHEIADTPPPSSVLRVVTLTDEDLGAGQAERYARYALADSANITLAPVNDDLKVRVAGLVDSALNLLKQSAPDLAHEIGALVRDLVLVQGGDATSDGFDGATTFYLWGALFLNAQRIENRVQLAVAVVHEAAHAFLFGINLGVRLTENLDEELFASPLRAEPRPVEGVFHATFVLARMIYALDGILASDVLAPGERVQAEAMRRAHIDGFRLGVQSLTIAAKLTPLGAQLLDDAQDYVGR